MERGWRSPLKQLVLTLIWCGIVIGPLVYLFTQLFGQPVLRHGPWEMVCTGQIIKHRKCVVAMGQIIESGFYIFAFGQKATGIVAVGQIALGLVAIGQAGIGAIFSVFMVGVNVGVICAMVCVGGTSPGALLAWELVRLPRSRTLLGLYVFSRDNKTPAPGCSFLCGKTQGGDSGGQVPAPNGSAPQPTPSNDIPPSANEKTPKYQEETRLPAYAPSWSSSAGVPAQAEAYAPSYTAAAEAPQVAVAMPVDGQSVEDRLRQLRDLRDRGLLSEEEHWRLTRELLAFP